MKNIDLTHVHEHYQGMWVTLTDSYKVISADKSARKAYADALHKGYKEPILFKVILPRISGRVKSSDILFQKEEKGHAKGSKDLYYRV